MRRHPFRSTGDSTLLVGAVALVAATLAMFGPATAAAAAPSPTPTTGAAVGDTGSNVGPPTDGTAVCSISAAVVNQVTGMVATDKGIYVINGAGDGNPAKVTIYTVDTKCKSAVKDYNLKPRDPQDLALGSDGALWISDTGDKDGTRPWVTLEKVVLADTTATPYRMVFPGGAKLSAKAMLLAANDIPLIFAQNGTKVEIYTPSKELVPDIQTNLPALKKVGEFVPVKTGTPNPKGAIGAGLVTGAAKSPDGTKVVIRTYSDAYEYDVADGDIVKAITSSTPRITPLPNEVQGEAISYSTDGASFLTLSWQPKSPLLKYAPFVPAAGNQTANPTDDNSDAAGGGGSFLSKLSFSQMTRMVAAVGVVGLVLAVAGIVGIRRARRRRREEEEDEYDDYDDYDEPRGRGGRGRGRGDEHSFANLRDQHYPEAYDQYSGGGGYGANGYGANAPVSGQYGANAPVSGQYPGQYGADPYAQQYGAQQQYGTGQYGVAGQYGADQYGAQPYAAPQQYGADQYGTQQYGAAGQYGADQYGAQPYAAPQQYGADYGAQGYGAPPQDPGYGPTSYGQPPQGYGYGYEDDFDPRRR